ncbi:protein indeterminate-domain 2-like [Cynara cardunculus var. scolymus]|uniref:protein indeterminate-domain 2-like n=1 Tax=Cynara cardunculus var. scolymus TaxID=59895 RepID=UPI000D627C35|nr:protein indeterminate-domain 2-like [Cynara cardunculus var. scolymus]
MMKQQKVILEKNMSNLSSASADLHANNSCSENKDQENGNHQQSYFEHPDHPTQSQPQLKRKRSLPGNPDPEAEVISLSPKTLMATNRFVCEICNKGFQRDQNLQLHRRGHNLPWKLKQRNKNEVVKKKVYVCPEVNCVHHEPSRALGDLTGIKKHFCRKHGEKKWKCDKCSKRYAVQSDWKAHSKTCGTREYRCDCGTLFSRRDSFITHRAFCDALAEENARAISGIDPTMNPVIQIPTHFNDVHLLDLIHTSLLKKGEHPFPTWLPPPPPSFEHINGSGPGSGSGRNSGHQAFLAQTQSQEQDHGSPSSTSTSHGGSGPTLITYHPAPSAYMSATALLQKAAQMGTSHLSRPGTSLQAPCTTSSSSMAISRTHHHHHQQYYQAHVSANSEAAGNNNGGTLLDPNQQQQILMGLASFGNVKDGGACAGGPSSSSSSPPHHHPYPSPAFLHHPMNMNINNMMMMNPDGFADVSMFEDAFSQILDAKKEDDDHDHHGNLHESHPSSKLHHHHMMMEDNKSGNGGNIGGRNGGNEGMTRDFLGLKAPSHDSHGTTVTKAGL